MLLSPALRQLAHGDQQLFAAVFSASCLPKQGMITCTIALLIHDEVLNVTTLLLLLQSTEGRGGMVEDDSKQEHMIAPPAPVAALTCVNLLNSCHVGFVLCSLQAVTKQDCVRMH